MDKGLDKGLEVDLDGGREREGYIGLEIGVTQYGYIWKRGRSRDLS